MDETEYIPVGTCLKELLIEARKKHEDLARDINDLDKSYKRFIQNDGSIDALRSRIERVQLDREKISKLSCEIVNCILNAEILKNRRIDRILTDKMDEMELKA